VNREETTRLLAIVRAVDNRVLDDTTAQVWHKLLMDVSFDDAAEAVRRHLGQSTDYLMPVHVLRGAQVVMAERAALESANRPALPSAFDTPRPGQRGPLLVRHVLAGLAGARERMGGRLGRELAAELGETFMAEALKLYPLEGRAKDVRGHHCGRAGCQCTHTDGCDGGWIELEHCAQPDPVLFGDQPQPVEDQGGRLRPCANCRPTVVEILEAASTRRGAMQTMRLRRVGRR
jgi:hypothetical protein